MTDKEVIAAVEQDADIRERLTDTFNERGRALDWFENGKLRDEYVHDAFEWLMGTQAGLNAAGLPGFNGMELMVASVRDASFIFRIDE